LKNVFGGQYPVGAKIKIRQMLPLQLLALSQRHAKRLGGNAKIADNFVLVFRGPLCADRLVGRRFIWFVSRHQYRINCENQQVLDRLRRLDAILRRSRACLRLIAPGLPRASIFSANRQANMLRSTHSVPPY